MFENPSTKHVDLKWQMVRLFSVICLSGFYCYQMDRLIFAKKQNEKASYQSFVIVIVNSLATSWGYLV